MKNKKILVGAFIAIIVIAVIVVAVVLNKQKNNKNSNDSTLTEEHSSESEQEENQVAKGLDTTGPSGYNLIFLSSLDNDEIVWTGSILDTYIKKSTSIEPNKITVNDVELAINSEISLSEVYNFLGEINKTCPVKDNGTFLDIEDGKTEMTSEDFEELIATNDVNSQYIDITFEIPYIGNYDNGTEQEDLNSSYPTIKVRIGARTRDDCNAGNFTYVDFYFANTKCYLRTYEKEEYQLSGVIFSYDDYKLDIMIDNFYNYYCYINQIKISE